MESAFDPGLRGPPSIVGRMGNIMGDFVGGELCNEQVVSCLRGFGRVTQATQKPQNAREIVFKSNAKRRL